MNGTGRRRAPVREHGAALLIVLGLIAGGMVATLLVAAPAGRAVASRDGPAHAAQVEARAALIGYAAMNPTRPGALPCPDTDNDGNAEAPSGGECPSYVGRLPWRTLGLPDLRDGANERLWYAVSRSLRDDAAAQPINSDTVAELSVAGTVPAPNLAAVLIAPGPALPGQSRAAADENTLTNYLEGGNADGDSIYQSAAVSTGYNDLVGVVTPDQLFHAVERRVAGTLREVLRRYFAAHQHFPYANSYTDATLACTNGTLRGRLPNPDGSTAISATCSTNGDWVVASGVAPPPWFLANGWDRLTYYAVAPACSYAGGPPSLNCNGAGGFLTVNGISGVRAVVIVGGRAIGAQTRPCAQDIDCIEQPQAGTNQYQLLRLSATFNDKLAMILP